MTEWQHYTCDWYEQKGDGRTVAVPVGWENSDYEKIPHKICLYGREDTKETWSTSVWRSTFTNYISDGFFWKVEVEDV